MTLMGWLGRKISIQTNKKKKKKRKLSENRLRLLCQSFLCFFTGNRNKSEDIQEMPQSGSTVSLPPGTQKVKIRNKVWQNICHGRKHQHTNKEELQQRHRLEAVSITKTRLYNFDPLKPHFYLEKKLGPVVQN